jgi:hypothetical protein
MKAVGVVVIVLFGAFLFGNGLLMLLSPKVWFRLPSWLGVHGSLTKKKYSRGPASVEVRLLGAIFVAVISWVVYDAFIRH